jgi:hypothetical protein
MNFALPLPKNMSEMKVTIQTAITLLCILASTSIAMPLGDSIPLPQNAMGTSRCGPSENYKYTLQFTSVLGGQWTLTGHRHRNPDGSVTDSFSGTVSDTTMQQTFTRNDFDWVSDSYYLCSHAYVYCSSFSMTVSNGRLTGFATYSAR